MHTPGTRTGRTLALSLGLGLVGMTLAGAGGSPPPSGARTAEVSYAEQIMPIFEQRCVRCHGGVDEEGERTLEALLDLTTYDGLMAGSEFGTVIEPGDVEGSILVEMITTGEMPDEGDPVPPEEIELISAWVAEGARNN